MAENCRFQSGWPVMIRLDGPSIFTVLGHPKSPKIHVKIEPWSGHHEFPQISKNPRKLWISFGKGEK